MSRGGRRLVAKYRVRWEDAPCPGCGVMLRHVIGQTVPGVDRCATCGVVASGGRPRGVHTDGSRPAMMPYQGAVLQECTGDACGRRMTPQEQLSADGRCEFCAAPGRKVVAGELRAKVDGSTVHVLGDAHARPWSFVALPDGTWPVTVRDQSGRQYGDAVTPGTRPAWGSAWFVVDAGTSKVRLLLEDFDTTG